MSRRARAEAPASPVLPLRTNDLLFLNEYFRNGQNATQAYRVVHPNAKYSTAEANSRKVLGKARVQAEVARRVRYDAGITRDFVSSRLLEYEDVAHAKGDYLAGASICMDAAKLAGLITDKREVTTVSDGDSRAIRDLVQRAMRQPASLSSSVNSEDGTPSDTPHQYPPASSVPTVSMPDVSPTVAPTVDAGTPSMYDKDVVHDEPKRPCDGGPDDPPRPEER